MDGAAFDIAMMNHDPHVFEEAARAVGFLGFGFYREPRNNFMHIDLGPKRTWGSRWPRTAICGGRPSAILPPPLDRLGGSPGERAGGNAPDCRPLPDRSGGSG